MAQAISSASLAADAKGWVEEDCLGSIFHFAKIDGTPISQKIILRLSRGSGISLALCMTEADAYEVHGKRCSGDGKCEEAIRAKVWLHKGNGRIRRVSGRYTVDFSGQHLEGQFMVNYRKHKKPFICE